MMRRSWVDLEGGLPVVRQCVLTGVSRATVYVRRPPEEADEADLRLCCLIDEEYTRRPFYGSRRMVVFLKRAGYGVNCKRVQRLMRQMGLAGMAPGAEHQPAPPRAPDLPLSATRGRRGTPKSGLEHRYNLHPLGARFCLSGRDHRRV
jgi:putative transposase